MFDIPPKLGNAKIKDTTVEKLFQGITTYCLLAIVQPCLPQKNLTLHKYILNKIFTLFGCFIVEKKRNIKANNQDQDGRYCLFVLIFILQLYAPSFKQIFLSSLMYKMLILQFKK